MILVKLPVALSGGSSVNTEPGSRREARHDCRRIVSPGKRVDRDRHRLSGLQAGELGLLEVRVDEDVGQRHQRGDALPGLHEVADLGRTVADDAVERRADLGERQIALGLGERGLELFEGAHGFLLSAPEARRHWQRRCRARPARSARRHWPGRGWRWIARASAWWRTPCRPAPAGARVRDCIRALRRIAPTPTGPAPARPRRAARRPAGRSARSSPPGSRPCRAPCRQPGDSRRRRCGRSHRRRGRGNCPRPGTPRHSPTPSRPMSCCWHGHRRRRSKP